MSKRKKEDEYVHCPKCHARMILGIGYLTIRPHSEPFVDGEKEDCGFEERECNEGIFVHYCLKCKKVMEIWVDTEP